MLRAHRITTWVAALVGGCGSPHPSTNGTPDTPGFPLNDCGCDAPIAGGPTLIASPGDSSFDPGLADKARSYDRQFRTFNAMPFGLSLDAIIPDASDRDLVSAFLAQPATDDFAAFTGGRTVRDIVAIYDEHGDLGMFAGAAAAGDAFRYLALRDSGADATAARADLLAAIAAFHVAATITGVPGTVARGIRRLDEPGAPPTIEPIPGSCPQSGDRGNRWRADATGQYPGFIYNDNNSKDQLIGYVFALGAMWDAIADDPSIPQSVRDQLQSDARALAHSLMTVVPLGIAGSADLIVRDWRDCPTKHLDLNPRVVPVNNFDPIILAANSTNQNGWNAFAALGVIRTLYHIAGDPDIGRYYYDELVGARDFPRLAITGPAHVGAMYQDGTASTNFSNVNMAFVAGYGVLRYETDPTLRAKYESILARELWDANHPHDGESTQQALFNLLHSAFATAGNDAAATAAAIVQLGEFVTPPYFDYPVENCDAGELAAGTCTAIDGTAITLVAANQAVSRTPLPKRLRPPSDFEWRSDPRAVNGGGVIRLNPGGDFRLAYWMGRVLRVTTRGSDNLSPHAR